MSGGRGREGNEILREGKGRMGSELSNLISQKSTLKRENEV